MRVLRIAVKSLLLAAHFALGAALACVLRGRFREKAGRRWLRAASAILRLRVRVIGAPTLAPALFVANHVSYAEVVALGALAPLSFVAKDEVRRWPVVGRLATAYGALFLRRGSAPAAARAVSAVVERLAGGASVAVFPEGTSTIGADVLPFKPSFFEAAARLGCDVQPVSVHYPPRAGRPSVAPFVGDDEFVPHLLRVLAEPEIEIELVFARAFSGHGRTRGELAEEAWAAVSAGLDARRRARGSRPTPVFRERVPAALPA